MVLLEMLLADWLNVLFIPVIFQMVVHNVVRKLASSKYYTLCIAVIIGYAKSESLLNLSFTLVYSLNTEASIY